MKYKNKFNNETKSKTLFIKTNNGQQKNNDYKNFMEMGRRVKKQVFL